MRLSLRSLLATAASTLLLSSLVSASTPINPTGKVIEFNKDTLKRSVQDGTPWFVEFFSPTCAHCKKLAPVWEEVGGALTGRVNVAKFDCDADVNFCMSIDIKAYPTFRYYMGDEMLVYSGPRNVDAFVDYALEYLTVKDTNIMRTKIDLEIEKKDVVYVFADKVPGPDMTARGAVKDAIQTLFLHRQAFFTIDSAFARLNNIPQESLPALVVFKDNAMLRYEGDLHNSTLVKEWMRSERESIFPRLEDSNTDKMFYGTDNLILVIIDPDSEKGQDVKLEGLEAAKQYYAANIATEDGKYAPTFARFAWLDGVKWSAYINRIFGYHPKEHLPRVVVMNSGRHLYWDTRITGTPIRLTAPEMLEAVNDILDGKVEGQSTLGFFLTIAYRISEYVGPVYNYFSEHIFLAIAAGISVLVLLYFTVMRCCCCGCCMVDDDDDDDEPEHAAILAAQANKPKND
ncbi:hypothetical protein GQ42DRAFT_38645 [Ramicandelaber brevisporus]|nr:hypothetical protein GQ42DRAFT_38645 [Ramicandelaber brevisporus]